MIKYNRQSRSGGTINITPMLDIIFLLLVFFLLTSTLSQQSSINMDLPDAKTAESSIIENRVVLAIVPEQKLSLETDGNVIPVTLQTIGGELAKINNNNKISSVIINGDQNISYKDLVRVVDKCRESGFRNISLAVTERLLNE